MTQIKITNLLKSFPVILLIISINLIALAQESQEPLDFTIARIKYEGGGDWYCDPSSLPNLLDFAGKNAPVSTALNEKQVSIMDEDFFSYPYLYISGHGNIKFSKEEVLRLRRHLQQGGFLHADDNYGMDESFRREIAKVFPDNELVEIPASHNIYNHFYNFPKGLPKIHEHDGEPARGYGIFYKDRLVVYYSYESDLGDGWESPEVHNDPPEKREAALKMGTNIILYALTQ